MAPQLLRISEGLLYLYVNATWHIANKQDIMH
jgi:hypothetical protein